MYYCCALSTTTAEVPYCCAVLAIFSRGVLTLTTHANVHGPRHLLHLVKKHDDDRSDHGRSPRENPLNRLVFLFLLLFSFPLFLLGLLLYIVQSYAPHRWVQTRKGRAHAFSSELDIFSACDPRLSALRGAARPDIFRRCAIECFSNMDVWPRPDIFQQGTHPQKTPQKKRNWQGSQYCRNIKKKNK